MIYIESFIKNFAAQFEHTDESEFTVSTKFKELNEWDSLVTLSIIGMVHNTYGIELKGSDIRNSINIQELFTLVVSKLDSKQSSI